MKFKFCGEDVSDAITYRRFLKILELWRQSDDAHAVQKLFIYNHVAEFFELFGKRYSRKILEDIWYILSEKWALEIYQADFYHGHICGRSRKVIKDLDVLLSPSNVCFLYHTFEFEPRVPQAINRSILSFPGDLPKPVYPKHKFETHPWGNIITSGKQSSKHYGVSSSDLGLMEYARIFFQRKLKGRYKLKDGSALDICGKFP